MFKFVLFLLAAGVCSAADWSSLYDNAKLEAEKPRIQKALTFLIEKEITPFVPQQAATSFGLQDIDLSVNGFRSNPLDFYAEGRRIVLPVRTLLFLEDLSRAYGWMWANRYTTKTADEYLSMLRYRNAADFPEAKFPPPLVALHVPDNALTDQHVVDAAVRLRRTAYAFILLHQFAHLQLHHGSASGRGYSDAEEEEADRYALDIMKGNSVTPTGVLLVMHSLLFLEGGEEGALHPVTSKRLLAMSHYFDARVMEFIRGRPDKTAAMDGIHAIALLLGEASEWLEVKGHQEELRQLALKTDVSTLQPRPLPKTTK